MRSSPQPKEAAHHSEPEDLTPVVVATLPMDPKRRRRYLQIGFGTGALVVVVVVLYLLRDFLGAIVLGAAIAFVIQPGIARLGALGVPRVVAVALILVAIIAALAGLVLLVVPLVVNEVGTLQVQAPGLAAAAQDRINSLEGAVQVFGFKIDLKGATASISSHLREYLLGQFGNAVGIGLGALTTLLQLLLTFIVAFLFAIDAAAIRKVLRRLVPNDYRTDFDQIWRRVRKMLYAYIRGQLIIAAMIGVLSGIACAVLGLPDAIALGLVAGITALIPYLGPFIGAIPAILVGLAASPLKALLVVAVYFLISNVILNFVYPKVVGDAVRLPPILVIVAFLAGFSWAGILGMFVAVPLAATLRILFDHIYPRLYEKPA
ncbi:MAG: AI-2E family transporter [Candidatus Dormibacteraeota bacterium]|nr:AI-2E family transporter [Candidatus Dormibacteraeota bacterium]